MLLEKQIKKKGKKLNYKTKKQNKKKVKKIPEGFPVLPALLIPVRKRLKIVET